MELLPHILDRKTYNGLFTQDQLWEPAIQYLVKKHKLCGEVRRGVLGSHIVYRIGDFWIKLMAPLFVGEMKYELAGLEAVRGNLSVQVPEIVAQGDLEGWKYLVMSHVPGEPIKTLWPQFAPEHKNSLATQIASIVKELKLCPVDATIRSRFNWNNFVTLQISNLEAQQKDKKLPEVWIQKGREFIDSFSLDSFLSHSPQFVHADLTYDHFLVSLEGDTPRVSGIIDMADCQVAHPEYDLIAPAVFVFKGDKENLKIFLQSYGLCNQEIDESFSQKLLAWSLIHRYFGMVSFFKSEMSQVEPGDFRGLAKLVFPL